MKLKRYISKKVVEIVAFTFVCILSILIILYLFLLIAIGGDDYPNYAYHTHGHEDLFTVAINSILGTSGYIISSRRFPAMLTVYKEDKYGRILFRYSEVNSVSTASLVISQYSDGEYVYFYPHHNFIDTRSGSLRWLYEQDLLEDIEIPNVFKEFLERNSWNQPLNLTNARRVRITNTKIDRDGPISRADLLLAQDIALGDDASRRGLSARFFITDDYGRSIYLFSGRSSQSPQRFVVLIFQPNGYLDVDNGIMELVDFQNYQDDLKNFKYRNNWNQAW